MAKQDWRKWHVSQFLVFAWKAEESTIEFVKCYAEAIINVGSIFDISSLLMHLLGKVEAVLDPPVTSTDRRNFHPWTMTSFPSAAGQKAPSPGAAPGGWDSQEQQEGELEVCSLQRKWQKSPPPICGNLLADSNHNPHISI